MKVLFIWVALLCASTLHAENSFFNGGYHQGLKPGLQGTYNNNPEQFVTDMFSGKPIFQVPNFAQAFLENARYALQDPSINFKDLKKEIVIDGAPIGLIKDAFNSSYEISRWNDDYSEIQWTARFPNKGEKFLWFRGVCIGSVYCGNLVRPRFVPEDVAIVEEDPNLYVATERVKATYVSNPAPVVNVYNTITSTNTNNNTSPIGASNLEFGDGGGSSNRRQSYNDGPQEVVVRNKRDALDYLNAAANLANATFSGINTFRGVKIMGGGRQQQSYQQPYRPRNNYNSGGSYNTGRPYGPGFQNNYNSRPQIRYTNDQSGSPVQGGFRSVQGSNSGSGYSYTAPRTTPRSNSGGFNW